MAGYGQAHKPQKARDPRGHGTVWRAPCLSTSRELVDRTSVHGVVGQDENSPGATLRVERGQRGIAE